MQNQCPHSLQGANSLSHLTSTFASLAIDVALFITLFLIEPFQNGVQKMSWRYSAMNGGIGISLWNNFQKWAQYLGNSYKKLQFCFDEGIIYMPLQTDQSCDSSGILDLGPTHICDMYVFISVHIIFALSATWYILYPLSSTKTVKAGFFVVETFM